LVAIISDAVRVRHGWPVSQKGAMTPWRGRSRCSRCSIARCACGRGSLAARSRRRLCGTTMCLRGRPFVTGCPRIFTHTCRHMCAASIAHRCGQAGAGQQRPSRRAACVLHLTHARFPIWSISTCAESGQRHQNHGDICWVDILSTAHRARPRLSRVLWIVHAQRTFDHRSSTIS
jgi:hypothetical protein